MGQRPRQWDSFLVFGAMNAKRKEPLDVQNGTDFQVGQGFSQVGQGFPKWDRVSSSGTDFFQVGQGFP